MLNKKQISIVYSLLLSLFTIIHPIAFADTQTEKSLNHSSTENEEAKQHIHLKTLDPYNAWVWVGAGFLFENSSLQKYIDNPTMDYQVGVAKSFWNLTPYDFFYAGLIFDFAYSKKSLGTNSLGLKHDALYYFSNEQLVLGYEQIMGTPYLSLFLEAGGAFQQRYFGIRETISTTLTDYIFAKEFGGTFNAGINIKLLAERKISYLLRLGMNFMVGPNASQILKFSGQKVNADQLSYGPSLSFGVRM